MWGFILEGESVIYNNCDEDDNNDDDDDDDDDNNDNDDNDDDDLHDCCNINNWVLFSRVRSFGHMWLKLYAWTQIKWPMSTKRLY